MSEWNKIEDGLPGEFKSVLIYSRGVIYNGFHEAGKWELEGPAASPDEPSYGVTHWMPLPEKPQCPE